MLRFFSRFKDEWAARARAAWGVFALECLRNHYLLFVRSVGSRQRVRLVFILPLFPQVFFRDSVQWPGRGRGLSFTLPEKEA